MQTSKNISIIKQSCCWSISYLYYLKRFSYYYEIASY